MIKANGWRVTAQVHTEQYTANGSFEPVVKVSIVTDNGTPATFAFPQAKYTPDNVADVINAWADTERAVAALGN